MKSGKVFWASSLLLIAAGLICGGLGFKIAEYMSVGQMIFGILFFAWTLAVLITARSAVKKLEALAPLALLYWTEKSVFEHFAGKSLIDGWIVFVSALLVIAALRILIPAKAAHGNVYENKLGEADRYLDATKSKHWVSNKFGEYRIYFENVKMADEGDISLELDNKFGQTTIYVPAEWQVENLIESSLGAVVVRQNASKDGKKLILTGFSKFGEVVVK